MVKYCLLFAQYLCSNGMFYNFSVLTAIFTAATRVKLLRESDALEYLYHIRFHSIIAGLSLLFSIVCFIGGMIPVFYLSYGSKITMYLIIPLGASLGLYSIWMKYIQSKRHAGHYYMSRVGTLAYKQKRGLDDDVNDPYDPSLAYHLLKLSIDIAQVLEARDAEKTGTYICCLKII